LSQILAIGPLLQALEVHGNPKRLRSIGAFGGAFDLSNGAVF
jgi:hypothetical protein